MAVQATPLPTRKLATMLIGVPALYAIIGPAIAEAWPQLVPAALSGPAMTALISSIPVVIITGIVAYFIPDSPNIPVTGDIRG